MTLLSFCKADCSDVESLIQPNTKLILVESPGSILYEVIDLPKLCKIAHAHNIPVAIDNTYSSGYLYNPLKLGADISVIAATKYLSGHSDVTMGVVVCNEKEWKNFDKLPEALGFTTSPDDCYLVLRGMRTLAVRMNQIELWLISRLVRKLRRSSIRNFRPIRIMTSSCATTRARRVC